MKQRSGYVFGAALASAALGGLPGLMNRAHAAAITNAGFTFETSGLAISTSVTGASIGPLIAESGTGSAFGSHLATSTVYSSPSGNGSPHSFSSNVWAAGDYYQFNVPTTGIQNILFSFDQTSSATGPKVFALYYSTDGSSYLSYTGYTVLANAAGTTGTTTAGAWNTSTSQPVYNFALDLSAVTGLNNDANAGFRLVEADTTTATGGTDRVDNVVVSGSAIPEPATVSLLTAAAAGSLLRRRRSS